jgi:molecular chaperone Hsp33
MDALKKMMAENGEALIYGIDATETVQESMERLQSFPPATVHLGQAMMAAILLQAMSAEKEGAETVALEWIVDGPFGHLYAEARNYGEVRSTIGNPQAPIFDYTTKLGQGQLRVRRTRTLSTTGLVSASGDVVLDLLSYLENSEQRQAGMNLSVQIAWKDPASPEKGFTVERAIGYVVDILPQSSPEKFTEALVRWNRRMLEIPQLSRWALQDSDRVTGMLQLISGEPNPKISLVQRVVFSCHCSEERAERALALAKSHDPDSPAQSEQVHEVKCEYCGRVYSIQGSP